MKKIIKIILVWPFSVTMLAIGFTIGFAWFFFYSIWEITKASQEVFDKVFSDAVPNSKP